MSRPHLYRLKCSIVGDYGVGKTTLVNLISGRNELSNIESTKGVEFFMFDVPLIESPDQQIRLHLWDTAGTERFRSIITAYLRDDAFVLIAFDLTDPTSWDSAVKWREMILDIYHRSAGSASTFQPFFALVGCKADLKSEQSVSAEEIRKRRHEWNHCPYFEVSSFSPGAKRYAGSMFSQMASVFHRHITENGLEGINNNCCSLANRDSFKLEEGSDEETIGNDMGRGESCLKSNCCR